MNRRPAAPFDCSRLPFRGIVSVVSSIRLLPVEASTMNNGTAILERLIEPRNDDLTPEAAQYILSLDFPRKDHRRMKSLSAKASAGTLSKKEQDELDDYLRVADLLAILHSKARRSLKRAGAL
jgi:hypothetical protein